MEITPDVENTTEQKSCNDVGVEHAFRNLPFIAKASTLEDHCLNYDNLMAVWLYICDPNVLGKVLVQQLVFECKVCGKFIAASVQVADNGRCYITKESTTQILLKPNMIDGCNRTWYMFRTNRNLNSEELGKFYKHQVMNSFAFNLSNGSMKELNFDTAVAPIDTGVEDPLVVMTIPPLNTLINKMATGESLTTEEQQLKVIHDIIEKNNAELKEQYDSIGNDVKYEIFNKEFKFGIDVEVRIMVGSCSSEHSVRVYCDKFHLVKQYTDSSIDPVNTAYLILNKPNRYNGRINPTDKYVELIFEKAAIESDLCDISEINRNAFIYVDKFIISVPETEFTNMKFTPEMGEYKLDCVQYAMCTSKDVQDNFEFSPIEDECDLGCQA